MLAGQCENAGVPYFFKQYGKTNGVSFEKDERREFPKELSEVKQPAAGRPR